MPNPKKNIDGVFNNSSWQMVKFDNLVEINRNEVVMYIMWYERIDGNSDNLEYHVS